MGDKSYPETTISNTMTVIGLLKGLCNKGCAQKSCEK